MEAQEHLIVEAGTGVGKSLAYLIPSILFAVAAPQEGRHLHPHHQFAGATDRQGPAHAGRDIAGEIRFHHVEGPAELSLHPPPGTNLARQAGKLFTSPEEQELRRIHEWSKKTEDGSLSDFDLEPDAQSLAAGLLRARPMLAQIVRLFNPIL